MALTTDSYDEDEEAESAVNAFLDEGLLSEHEAEEVASLLDDHKPMEALEKALRRS